MSDYFADSNDENARDLFFKRKNYRTYVISTEDVSNIVDFNFGEKLLYGRVDRFFVPMVFDKTFSTTKKLKNSADPSKSVSVMNFVAEAFSDLSQQFDKCAMAGKISSNDKYLSKLTAYKAYEDPKRKYLDYLDSVFAALASQFNSKQIVFKDFGEFMREIMVLLPAFVKSYPFTKPAYMKSRFCPINCSALVVEIADLDPTNDAEKISDFISSVNWDFYVNACNSYGFMVDKLIPWRIVADIGSEGMIEYAKKYNHGTLTSLDDIIKSAYIPAHVGYYKKFKFLLLNLYNKLKPKKILINEECNGRTVTKVVVPVDYSKGKLSEDFSDIYFLELYLKIRFLEEESEFQPHEQDKLISDSIALYRIHGVGRSLYNFERILNKPFDYRGSMSYISIQQKARRDAEEP
jgi:hypothetical protein